MEVHKVYCDRQSCKKEITTKNNRCKAIIGIKKPSEFFCDLRENEITINVDLCPECAEKLRGILSEFFNEGCRACTETGREEISTEWKPVGSKF